MQPAELPVASGSAPPTHGRANALVWAWVEEAELFAQLHRFVWTSGPQGIKAIAATPDSEQATRPPETPMPFACPGKTAHAADS